jgi:hypothetical protein
MITLDKVFYHYVVESYHCSETVPQRTIKAMYRWFNLMGYTPDTPIGVVLSHYAGMGNANQLPTRGKWVATLADFITYADTSDDTPIGVVSCTELSPTWVYPYPPVGKL